VTDTAFRPLAGAVVELLDGPDAGTRVEADAFGTFVFVAEFEDHARFRATANGYVDNTQLMTYCARCNPQWRLTLLLAPEGPTVDLRGEFTMAIRAGAACAAYLGDARELTYAVTFTRATNAPTFPAGTVFDANVSGGQFVGTSNRFRVFLAGMYLTAWFGDFHGTPGTVDEIGPLTYVTVGGELLTTVTDDAVIHGAFNGEIERCELTAPWGTRQNCMSGPRTAVAMCHSTAHEMTLTRR
jgi:hypothetical protein